MGDILISDIIFWLQIFFLGISVVIFTRAWALRRKIRKLEKMGLIAGLKEVEEAAKAPTDPKVRGREAITWRLGYLKWDMSEEDIAYCRERLRAMGADYDAVERMQNAPAATIICELLATLEKPQRSADKSYALFAARGAGGAHSAFYFIAGDRGAFQLPEIRLLGVASKSMTKNYIIYYHGQLDHEGKTYEARIELGYYD